MQGIVRVCEDQRWKRFILCEVEWTSANTLVACRQLGYAAAGWLLAYTRFHYETHQTFFFAFAASYTVHVQSENDKALSYRPECSGEEERLVDCPHHSLSEDENEDCASLVVIGCWNSSTDNSQSTAMATHTSSSAITSTATMSSPDSPQPTSSVELQTSVLTSKSQSIIVTTSTIAGATSSPSPSVPDSASASTASILFGAIGAVIGILVVAILLTTVCICYRSRHMKEPIVQDRQYEVPISGQGNKTFHEIEQTTTLPETEILYDRAATSHQVPDESQVCHILNHSPATTHSPAASSSSASKTSGGSSSASKNSGGSSSDLPLNEALYEKVISSRTNLHRDAPTQKPPVYYHTLVNSQETPTTTTSHYHVPEGSNTGRVYSTPHCNVPEGSNTGRVYSTPHCNIPERSSGGHVPTMPHYHVLEGSNAGQMSTMPHYHVLEGSTNGHVEPLYHEVGRRKAATLPAQRTTRPMLNMPSRSLRLARHGGSATQI